MHQQKHRQKQKKSDGVLTRNDENGMITVIDSIQEKGVADGRENCAKSQENPVHIKNRIDKIGKKHHQDTDGGKKYTGDVHSRHPLLEIENGQKERKNRYGGDNDGDDRRISYSETVCFKDEVEERLEQTQTEQIKPIVGFYLTQWLIKEDEAEQAQDSRSKKQPKEEQRNRCEEAKQRLCEHKRNSPETDREDKK